MRKLKALKDLLHLSSILNPKCNQEINTTETQAVTTWSNTMRRVPIKKGLIKIIFY